MSYNRQNEDCISKSNTTIVIDITKECNSVIVF